MKFGKLPSIAGVDFSLPDDAIFNATAFRKLPQTNAKSKVYVGCTGWSMKEWIGKVYPKGTKAADYLKHYSRQFNTIEFNTTHYRIPDAKTIAKWYSESAKDFKFCPKILQGISHSRDMGLGDGKLIQFCEAIQGLEEKLGCCFIQMPPYFGIDRIQVLEKFLKSFPNHLPLAVEIRHESWFQAPEAINSFLELLSEYNIAPVITDVAGRRDVLHMGLTNDTVLIRFVGNNLHETDYSRIVEWIARLEHWVENGVKNIYIFTHEPDNILAPDLALFLVEKLQEKGNVEVRGPEFIEEGNGQMSLF